MAIKRGYRIFLLLVFLAFWIWAAVNPIDSEGWLNENYIVFAAVPLLIFFIIYFKISDFSATLITIFVVLHVIASHYTYLQVPFGYTLQNFLGVERNMYDRFMHFLFGFLLFYPIREAFMKISRARGFWTYYIPVDLVLSMSAFFEILELFVVLFIRPEATASFMGFQNDFWDTTKDILNAFIGALIAMSLVFALNLLAYKKTKKEFRASLSIKNGKSLPEEKRFKKLVKTAKSQIQKQNRRLRKPL